MRLKIAILAGAALVLAASQGQAQGFPDLGYMGTTIGAGGLQTSAMNNVISQSVQQSRSAPRRPSGYAASARLRQGGVAGASASTSYRASPQVAARVRKQFADYMTERAGADGGRQVAAAMERRDPVKNWAQIVAADGLRPGDAADSLAGYWILNWVIANRGDNNRAQAQAVRAQVRPIMASNPAYARLNEPQRQEMSEVLMLNFLVQHAAYLDALKRNDQNDLRRIGDAAVARFRNEMGVDLRQLQLTDNGFVRR
ncbi:DUF6683 family protein [Caulobacter hibisci]|uniref:Secreted protein n=1 Tax=Caulobacter hibisci TaxID=2035993 RepID=A0ABS0STN1_9CAUL|nr:DUF6683 family protein [Caulobacter hibisci]MBI1682716.1 hypothetical protein [Caulobacter hibisci]